MRRTKGEPARAEERTPPPFYDSTSGDLLHLKHPSYRDAPKKAIFKWPLWSLAKPSFLDDAGQTVILTGMKSADSNSDDIFARAERLARSTRRAPEEVTEAMNRVCGEVGDSKDPFVSTAARRILERSEW